MPDGNNHAQTVRDCIGRPECEWLEFKKEAGGSPQESIGQYISALANGAALKGRQCAYMIWGVEEGV